MVGPVHARSRGGRHCRGARERRRTGSRSGSRSSSAPRGAAACAATAGRGYENPVRRAARAPRRRDRRRRRPGRLPTRPLATAARLERGARPRRRGTADGRGADALPRDQAEPAAAHAWVDDSRDRGRWARPHGCPDPAGAHADADRRARRTRGRRAARAFSRRGRGLRLERRSTRPRCERSIGRYGATLVLDFVGIDETLQLGASLLGPGGRLTLDRARGRQLPAWPRGSRSSGP